MLYVLNFCIGLIGLGSIALSLIYLVGGNRGSESKKPTLTVNSYAAQQTELREATFRQLQSLLTTYPSIRQIVQVKPELPTKNIISLLTPLDNLLSEWGYEAIGSAWEQVEFNAQFHQPDSPDIAPGEMVYVRFVGYRDGSRILVPAKVSRNLPGGAS